MILNLYWKDNERNEYILGKLYKSDGKYHFDINEEELKKATHKGCFGIGEINLLYKNHVSDTLFDFFKRRIPAKDSANIEEILKELNMQAYDEMELLEKTNGILYTDRYYVIRSESEEVNDKWSNNTIL